MKKIKRLLLIVSIITMICSLTGCAMTTEKLLANIDKAYSGHIISGFNAEFPMEISMTVGEESSDIAIELEATFDSAVSDDSSDGDFYMEIDYKIDTEEETVSDDIQIYAEHKGDTFTTFLHMHTDSRDIWDRTDADAEFLTIGNRLPEIDPSAMVLAEETQQLNGTEVYVLSFTLSGEMLQESWNEAIAEMGSEPDDALKGTGSEDFDWKKMDFSALEFSFVLYVNAETYFIEKQECSIRNLDAVLNHLMSDLMESLLSALPEGAAVEPDFISFEIPDITLVISDLRLDGTEVPTISENDRITATLRSFNPDLGDGVYAIHDYGGLFDRVTNAVQFTVSDYRIVYDMAPNYVFFFNEEGTGSNIIFHYPCTSEEYIQDILMRDVGFFTDASNLRYGFAENIGDYKTFFISTYDDNYHFYAWKEVGNSVLCVEISNTKNPDIVKSLTPILDSIEPYEIQY